MPMPFVRQSLRGRLGLGVVGVLLSVALPVTAQAQSADRPAPVERPRVLVVSAQETTLVSQTVSQIIGLEGTLGASFKRGAPLVRFDCSELEARRGIADADVVLANTELNAKKRLKELKAAGDVEVDLAQAAVQKAQAQLKLATVQLQPCRVLAPFNGRVVKRHVSRYQGVRIGDPLLDIVSSGALKLRLNVPSHWLTWLKPGSPFTVTVDETGKDYPAQVKVINARVDAASQSIEIEAAIKGRHPELLSGMSGSATFGGSTGQ